MPKPERQQNVLDLLKRLRGIEPLKQLFWSELNYQRVNQPLSRRGWTELASKALADDPVLFAGGGEDNAFHIIYCRLASDALARGFERPVVTQLLREHPYALFVFSNQNQTDWHFLNVKYDDQVERRRLFRRITVRPGAGLRTATERVQLLDLAEINPELFGISPLAIQQRCDAAFDVETVTKDFFREIANWYFWALKNVRFPKDALKEADGHDHISIIRLITRLIFCWFVKEKGLIPDTLFDERKLTQTLTGFAPAETTEKESVFYKAILQNLFFATLNTEMDKRAWRKDDNNFMAHILYRHRALFQKPNEALDLFKNIPFLNGGLFECLDKREGTKESPKDIRIDGFSDRGDSQPIVPDFLFFGGEREVNLSAEYDDAKFSRVPVRGLIHIFNRYNFTVEENTPIEQEVALDPELSGKVFENLLAAYNPETGATARKQTGSFYTPREIVNYMVDEALIACLQSKLVAADVSRLTSSESKTGGQKGKLEPTDVGCYEAKLRHLFAYNDEPHHFTAPEVDVLIAAIDGLKSLDPAVGSGAFPMGILHKLVFILGKLDPRNEKWKERQIARVRDTMATAEKIEDATARERTVRELEQQITSINEAFEHNELDYGRKLYLIENCIYGVDIQPIAVQIAKMRFFISLIVDQKIDDTQPNRGVRPLPNLETKFVAANTLIGVNRPGQQLLRNREIDAKEGDLRRVRERYFVARTPKQKAKCRDDDARLRGEIAELLKGDGWDTATARKLASWNPYDQNASADFFDAEWMFGVTEGFDVVLGNPPYRTGLTELEKETFGRLYPEGKKKIFDLFNFFMVRGLQLCSEPSVYTFIVPPTWLNNKNSATLRRLFIQHGLAKLNYIAEKVFESAVVDSVIFFVLPGSKPDSIRCYTTSDYSSDGFSNLTNTLTIQSLDESAFLPQARPLVDLIADKVLAQGHKTLGDISEIMFGIQTRKSSDGPNYLHTERANKNCRPAINGKDMGRYFTIPPPLFVEYGTWLWNRRNEKIFLAAEKILIRQVGKFPICALDDKQLYSLNTIFNVVITTNGYPTKYVLALLNSSLVRYLWGRLFAEVKDVFPRVKKEQLVDIPICSPSKSSEGEIISAVEKILGLKRHNRAADTTALEQEIDQQVYALYGLTPEEVKTVEEATK